MALVCPQCGSEKYKVVDSRQSTDKPCIRRRRVCLDCGYYFSTQESVTRKFFVMDKRGTKALYSTYKLKFSITDAVGDSNAVDVNKALREIEDEILVGTSKSPYIDSKFIIERVLAYLKPRDWASFLRYAIAHTEATSLNEFLENIQEITKKLDEAEKEARTKKSSYNDSDDFDDFDDFDNVNEDDASDANTNEQ